DLPNRVFAMGYLRAYARHLGLDEQQAVADYDRLTSTTSKTRGKPLKTIGGSLDEAQRKGRAGKWILSIVVLAGAAGAANWWMNQQQAPVDIPAVAAFNVEAESSTAEETPATTETVVAKEPPVSTEQEDAGISQSTESAELNNVSGDAEIAAELTASGDIASELVPEVDEPAVATISEEVSVPSAAEPDLTDKDVVSNVAAQAVPVVNKPAPVVEGEGHLQISFDADCWVEVRDSTGKLLVASVRGTSRGVDVRGPAPMKVTLGALSSVDSMTFNNQSVELTQRGRGNILRMTLPVVE
ncbi:MAG: DUF4115 domain-containing protein, partial [Oceanospirillaceae bacterium]|nr:DUF4115 domain-containing protein [Oceanospirillaceae bacterium]